MSIADWPLFLFGIIALINIIYYVFFSKFIFQKNSTQAQSSDDPVSVIVCAKNAAQHLKKNIPFLLDQIHPNYEIIIVNDASIDDSLDVIEQFMEQDDKVHLVNVVNNESFWGNKKYALTLGIKKARHDKLLFIDADCKPATEYWITEMSAHYGMDKQLALGYGGYSKIKGNLLNALVRFETAITAMQYFSYALWGNPYMGVGRNLGYTSKLFYDTSGFMSHMKIMGGDDDLFVNEAATKKNTSVVTTPKSFTTSDSKNNWAAWWRQKRRHINTAQYYKSSHKFLLGLFYLSQFGFFITMALAFSFSPWEFVTAIVITRYITSWIVVGSSLSRFRESDIIIIYPILELLLIFSQLGLWMHNNIQKPTQWN
ncbi:N-acetylglucosaminyltransferase [Nonlabens tegetincola]|uniref:N-acetylglucosaminyltransferase n=1 Tax=Nonlabens tegetincola TaxID=323273 RepID=A0A090Q2L2_9FLAO|nr:glycosyltransferase [Nonlabens tegetincola]GAK97265.1 N-acetylglucosaminyltransferase [Nonlabens tegetincola]